MMKQVTLSPNFQERFKLLLEKEQNTCTIGKFFDLALVEFDNLQDQRFIKWLRLGFVGRSREILYADPMMVVIEHYLPLYLDMQNTVV